LLIVQESSKSITCLNIIFCFAPLPGFLATNSSTIGGSRPASSASTCRCPAYALRSFPTVFVSPARRAAST
jgi:hypothetical protein